VRTRPLLAFVVRNAPPERIQHLNLEIASLIIPNRLNRGVLGKC